MLQINLTVFNALLLVGFLSVSAPGAFGASEQPKRLSSNIDDSETFVLKGNIQPLVAKAVAQDQGEVKSSKVMPKMEVHFALTEAQQADLKQLLAAQQNRRSAQYHKFLTPEEYAARFGLNTADVEKITLWLETSGFSNVESSRSRMWVSFSGTAGQVQSAFHTTIHNYTVNGEAHFANATEPQLPKALEGVVQGVRGLHNFLPKAHIRLRPHFTSTLTQDTFTAPDDWETIYNVKPLYSAGLDGSPLSGETYSMVVVGQSDVQASDLAAFRTAAGLPAKTITTQIVPGDTDPGIVSGDEAESDLDLEWANAIAKNANILFVVGNATTAGGVQDAWTWAIDNNMAPILSTSYGLCEPQQGAADMAVEEALFAQANTNGMTIVGAAGDSGAADCDTDYPATLGLAVDYPASSAYVTGVGGTELTASGIGTYWGATNDGYGGSALQYIPEVVWNDTSVANGLEAGGGGVSIYIAKPSWQTGTGVPTGAFRDVPDIALDASPNVDGLLFCGHNWCTNGFRDSATDLDVTGGTSAGPPTFSAVLAMFVQQMGTRLGNVNPNLYTIAGISQTAFNNITSGNNIVPCEVGTLNCTTGTMGYSAGVGYNLASGWGSINAYNLLEQWSEDIQITATPTAMSISAGTSGTATITVAPYKNFAGTVSFACTVSSGLANVTCSLPTTTVTTSGTTTLTVTAGSTARTPFWRQFRNLPPIWPALLLLAMALATAVYTLRKQRFVYAFGAAAVLVFMLGAVSCGSGSSSSGSGGTGSTSPAAESGTVTVTATSGQIVNSVAVAVTIQ